MKQLQVLVVSDLHQRWEDTDKVAFQYYFPEGEFKQAEQLSKQWDFAIIDETMLGYLATNAIAQRLNATYATPIVYLVDDLEAVKDTDRNYVYSMGMFHKPSDDKLQNGGLETFLQFVTNKKEPQVKDAVFIFEKGNYYQKIPIHEILWIEAVGDDACKIITMRRPYVVGVTLKVFEQRFQHPSIVRTHNEYLVNITKVSGFDQHSTVIHQSRLPFSMDFRESVTKHFNLIGEVF